MALALTETAVKQVKQLMEAQNLEECLSAGRGQGGRLPRPVYQLESTTRSVPRQEVPTSTGCRWFATRRATLPERITLDYVTQGCRAGSPSSIPARKSSCGAGHRSRPEARPGRHERGPAGPSCCFEESLVSDYFTVFGLPRKLGVDGEACSGASTSCSGQAPSRFPPGGGCRAPGGSPWISRRWSIAPTVPCASPRARGVPDRAGRGSRGPGGRDRQAAGAPGCSWKR